LLYFVIKNHSLADGNKRSGSFLFLCYLRIHQHLLAKPVEHLINDNTFFDYIDGMIKRRNTFTMDGFRECGWDALYGPDIAVATSWRYWDEI